VLAQRQPQDLKRSDGDEEVKPQQDQTQSPWLEQLEQGEGAVSSQTPYLDELQQTLGSGSDEEWQYEEGGLPDPGEQGKGHLVDPRMGDYVQAYENARFYHVTHVDALQSIQQTGLQPSFGGTGMSDNTSTRDKPEYNKDTVHLANDLTNLSLNSGPKLRAFLPPDRTHAHPASGADTSPEKFNGKPRELSVDREGGTGAWITGEEIPKEALQFPEDQEPSDEALQIIGQHLQEGGKDVQELRELHKSARQMQRLSAGLVRPETLQEADKWRKKKG
jgi:hypothetical protein